MTEDESWYTVKQDRTIAEANMAEVVAAMKRSDQYKQGYLCAWKDAITFLHNQADGMNSYNAKAVLNKAAHDMGLRRRDWKEREAKP